MNFANPTPYYVGHTHMERICAKIEISIQDRKITKLPLGHFWTIPNFGFNFGINQGWLELNQVWSAWVKDQ